MRYSARMERGGDVGDIGYGQGGDVEGEEVEEEKEEICMRGRRDGRGM